MTQSVVDGSDLQSVTLPDLWVLTIIKPGSSPDIHEALRAMRAPASRTVLVTDESLSYVRPRCRHVVVSSDRDAVLWNAGLNFIQSQQDPGATWDVMLFDPGYSLPLGSVNNLRRHMRWQGVWMAEPDLYGTVPGGHQTSYEVEPGQVHPPLITVAGESGGRFDWRFFEGADSWAEFCRRTRCTGGSVVVSSSSMKGNIL